MISGLLGDMVMVDGWLLFMLVVDVHDSTLSEHRRCCERLNAADGSDHRGMHVRKHHRELLSVAAIVTERHKKKTLCLLFVGMRMICEK